MNSLVKNIWLLFARRKLSASNLNTRLSAIEIVGELGTPDDIPDLLPLIHESNTLVRNQAISALKLLYNQEGADPFMDDLLGILQEEELISMLAVIDILEIFPLVLREQYLVEYLDDANSDLLFEVIRSLEHTTNEEILDKILALASTKDLLLRRVIYTTWFSGIFSMQHDRRLAYATPLVHALIRATYEMNDNGAILREVLSNADKKQLPAPKAYPEFIIRYLVQLIHAWEYDVYIYRTLHTIVVPAYFTFDNASEKEAPYLIV